MTQPWNRGDADGAHLSHVFQEPRAREAVLRGATVCSVVEEAEELRIQLKESAADSKPRHSADVYTHTHTYAARAAQHPRALNQSVIIDKAPILSLLFSRSCFKVNWRLLQSVAKQQVKPPPPSPCVVKLCMEGSTFWLHT